MEDGSPILKGTEVEVTRYERGIAYVRPWSEMSGEENELSELIENRVEDRIQEERAEKDGGRL